MDKENLETTEEEIIESDTVEKIEPIEKTEKSFNQEEVNAIVKSRVERATKELKKEMDLLSKKIATQSLSDSEKIDYENNLKDEELERLRNELLKHQLIDVAKNELINSGIVPNFEMLEMVIGEDEDRTIEKTKAIISLIENQTNEKLKKIAREKTPTIGIKATKESESFNVAEFTKKNRKI